MLERLENPEADEKEACGCFCVGMCSVVSKCLVFLSGKAGNTAGPILHIWSSLFACAHGLLRCLQCLSIFHGMRSSMASLACVKNLLDRQKDDEKDVKR